VNDLDASSDYCDLLFCQFPCVRKASAKIFISIFVCFFHRLLEKLFDFFMYRINLCNVFKINLCFCKGNTGTTAEWRPRFQFPASQKHFSVVKDQSLATYIHIR
jgi:hypothetical protein